MPRNRMWKKYKSCINCGTTLRPHRGKGYCSLCKGPGIQLVEVKAWDQARTETLRRYPGRARLDTAHEFELLREGYLIELQRRLDWVRDLESTQNAPAGGIDIEFQLDRIAKYAGVRTAKPFHGLAGYIESQFGPSQLNALRELLRGIERARPWRGVNLNKVFQYRSDRLDEL